VVDRGAGVLRLMVEDDGCGFDPAATSAEERVRAGHLGLAGMRERHALIGGELELESSSGSGTTVFAAVRLDATQVACT
jgi:two-component system sensor histidine kinase UhpB